MILPFDRLKLLSVANHFADEEGTCLLYSGGLQDSSQKSYLALFPYDTLTLWGQEARRSRGGLVDSCHVTNPWDTLEAFLSEDQSTIHFGFIGYEMGAFSDPDCRLNYNQASTPDAYWQRCALVAEVDHVANTMEIMIDPKANLYLKSDQKALLEKLSSQEVWQTLALSQIQKNTSHPLRFVQIPNRKERYLSHVDAIQGHIREGSVYQANISQEFVFKGQRRPYNVFEKMMALNPAPFAAYFRYGEASALVSTSPERFLSRKGDLLETRPIKGTLIRGKTPEEDKANKEKLLSSPKERAELLMITDLMRNDLGKVSEIGSVVTREIWRCEAYANVFHLLSIIQSRARVDLSSLEIIKQCFPAGSITGCPKLRAMELIAELEQSPRGVYTGSIGYIKGNGDFDLNVAIRTLVCGPDSITLRLGAGIVIDSCPESEYKETLIKGETLFQVLNAGN